MSEESPAAVRSQRLPRPERRAQLLGAALGAFVENGYHQAAMDDIAARAGVSKPVLYQHFPGKLELYLALVDRHAAELERLVRDALSLADNKARIGTMVHAYFDFVARDGGAFRLIFESDLANEPAVRRRLDQIVLTCAEAMADLIRSQTALSQEEAVLVGVGLVGLAQTSARHWLAQEPLVSKEAATRITAALIRRGIGAFPALEREAHGGRDGGRGREAVGAGAG